MRRGDIARRLDRLERLADSIRPNPIVLALQCVVRMAHCTPEEREAVRRKQCTWTPKDDTLFNRTVESLERMNREQPFSSAAGWLEILYDKPDYSLADNTLDEQENVDE